MFTMLRLILLSHAKYETDEKNQRPEGSDHSQYDARNGSEQKLTLLTRELKGCPAYEESREHCDEDCYQDSCDGRSFGD